MTRKRKAEPGTKQGPPSPEDLQEDRKARIKAAEEVDERVRKNIELHGA